MSPSETVMTMVLLILAGVVVGFMMRKKVPKFPIPANDRQVVIKTGGRHIVLGYIKSTNQVSIWTAENEPVTVCRSTLSNEMREHFVTKNTGGYNEVLRMSGTTSSGQPITGTAYGQYRPGSDYEKKTGKYWVTLRVGFWVTKLPGDPDTRIIFPLDKVPSLLPENFKQTKDRRPQLAWYPCRDLVVDAATSEVLASFFKDTAALSESFLRERGLSMAWFHGARALHGR